MGGRGNCGAFQQHVVCRNNVPQGVCGKCMLYSFIIFNVLMIIIGAAILVMGVWFIFDSKMDDEVMGSGHYLYSKFILTGVGGVLIISGLFGILLVKTRSGCLFITYILIGVILLIGFFVGGFVGILLDTYTRGHADVLFGGGSVVCLLLILALIFGCVIYKM